MYKTQDMRTWLDLSDLESMDQWKRGSPEHPNKPLNKIKNEKFVDQLGFSGRILLQ